MPAKLITTENARELQAKAVESRRLRTEQARIEEARALIAEQEKPQAVIIANSDSYIQRRLSRVRLQIEQVDRLLEDETDPQKIDRLASALSRLSDIEQRLDGRPNPGSLRPTKKPTKSTQSQVDPVD